MAATQPKAEFILTTLDKGLRVLEVLGEDDSGGLTLTELGRSLGMHRSTLFRFMATLRQRGYVERDPVSDRYRLGIGALTLSSAYLSGLDLRRVARPHLEYLCDRTQELVHLTKLDRGDVVTIDRIEGKQPVSLQTEIGARRPSYCTASGKVFLAHLPGPEVQEILARGMPRHTPTTFTTPADLAPELMSIRAVGFAIDDEERIDGVRCVAAPIYDLEGSLAGAISIAAPAMRTTLDRLNQLGAQVRTAADQVSSRLGYSFARPPLSRSAD